MEHFSYNIQMEHWENTWLKELKFTLCHDLKQIFYIKNELLIDATR